MCEIPENFVTYDMVHNLRGDRSKFKKHRDLRPTKYWPGARFMIVCNNGDLNTAAYAVAGFMQEPFQLFPLATVAVHQSIRDEFIAMVRSRFRQLKPHVANHPNYERSLNLLQDGHNPVDYIIADEKDAPACASPVLVTGGVTHLYFPSGATGVTTLHSFETIHEAAEIFCKEQPNFDAVYYFDEGIASVYTLAKHIKCVQIYVNCLDACLLAIMPYYTSKVQTVLYKNGFHYEVLNIGGSWKIIVFPYSSSILRPCCCPLGYCRCYAKHTVCCQDHLNTQF
ncbi:uncharacterized protein DMAD_08894 [Drosophila madeirensis]|uniref:Uncharacterized protein n=1 Tax=Drosophila madeirensis TaxID=30013 RepID=A0AAU9F820_DROMD